MSLENVIGSRISELRNLKNETQQQLADALTPRVKRETINQWENGTRQLKAEAIISLANHFDVSTDYLLGVSDVASTDITIKEICDYIGLSETAIENISSFKETDMLFNVTIDDDVTCPRTTLDDFLKEENFYQTIIKAFQVNANIQICKFILDDYSSKLSEEINNGNLEEAFFYEFYERLHERFLLFKLSFFESTELFKDLISNLYHTKSRDAKLTEIVDMLRTICYMGDDVIDEYAKSLLDCINTFLSECE